MNYQKFIALNNAPVKRGWAMPQIVIDNVIHTLIA